MSQDSKQGAGGNRFIFEKKVHARHVRVEDDVLWLRERQVMTICSEDAGAFPCTHLKQKAGPATVLRENLA